jgi:hypothetical protein
MISMFQSENFTLTLSLELIGTDHLSLNGRRDSKTIKKYKLHESDSTIRDFSSTKLWPAAGFSKNSLESGKAEGKKLKFS